MHLIYRGQVYNYTPTAPIPYTGLRALNWRFQSPVQSSKSHETTFVSQPSRHYVEPRAINWRYRLAAGL
jgi:hypothetical protein